MQIREYTQLNETVYTETLDNGLTVIIIPKSDFNKTYALFGTEFGSIDQHFAPLNQSSNIKFPDGIAHFLEHKLFEKESGDVFHDFSTYGAAVNAFTSFTRTAYLFSTTHYVKENIQLLLDFVQEPYFTEETVEKEKGIIEQEIGMYDDEADFRLFMGILENLYPDHPVHIDILGSVESIHQITADMLYDNYNTFYHPSNMTLLVVGQVEPHQILSVIKENQNQKSFSSIPAPNRQFPKENLEAICSERTLYMSIQKPKVALGVRGTQTTLTGITALRYDIAMNLYIQMLLGSTSNAYLTWYDMGIIDDSYSIDFMFERTFNLFSVATDTRYPERFIEYATECILQHKTSEDINVHHFELVKRRMIGKILQSMNSIEYIAYQFMNKSYGEVNMFDFIPILEAFTLDDVKNIAGHYIKSELLSVLTILPKT